MTNQLSSNISGFSFDSTSNAAVATPGSPYIADFGPAPVLTNAAGTLVFAVMEEEAPTERGSNCFNAPGEVISYAVDAATGALTLVQRLTLQKFCAYGAAIQGSSLYLIAKDQGSDAWLEIVNFDSTGHLAEASGSPFDLGHAGADEYKVAVAPGGNVIFVTNRDSQTNQGIPGVIVYQRQADGSWGTSSTVNIASQWDIALTPNGRAMMTTNLNAGTVTTYSVDPATWAVVARAPSAVNQPFRVIGDPTGRFFAVAAVSGLWMYTVDAGGNIAPVSGSPFAAGPTYISVAFDSKGLYLTALSVDQAAILSVDQTTGALKPVAGPLPVGEFPADVVMLSK